jgi:hypothetical protein
MSNLENTNSNILFQNTNNFSLKNELEKPKYNNIYKPQLLVGRQKDFTSVKPVKPFNRFGKQIVADSGLNPDIGFIEFSKKDITQPLERPSYINNNKDIESEKQYFQNNPLRWSIGCTYKCNNPSLVPKYDIYKEYSFHPRKNEDNKRYQNYFLETDHIGIRIPDFVNKSSDSSNYLTMKSKYGPHAESKTGWVPKTYNINSVGNRNSVDYDIINFNKNTLTGVIHSDMLDKSVNNIKKGVAEFSDYLNPNNPNFNKEYQKYLKENDHIFYNYKGVCSNLYDSAAKNGGLYMPFRKNNEFDVSKKQKKRNYEPIY